MTVLRAALLAGLCLFVSACDKCGNFNVNPLQSSPKKPASCHSETPA